MAQTNIFPRSRSGRIWLFVALLGLIVLILLAFNVGGSQDKLFAQLDRFRPSQSAAQSPTPQPAAAALTLNSSPTPVAQPTAAPTATVQAQQIVKLNSGVQIDADGLYSPADGLNPFDPRLKSSGNVFLDVHNAKLLVLEETYIKREGNVPTMESVQAWMKASGATWTGIEKQARQVEEETIFWANGTPKIVVAGVQLLGTNFHATYPSAFTTDRKFVLDSNGFEKKIAPDNPSHIATNATISDTLTFYADASNWHEIGEALGVAMPDVPGLNMAPTAAAQAATPAPANATAAASCPNYQGFQALGDIQQVLMDNGQPAGVQMTFKAAWTPPANCVDAIQLNGSKVPSAPAGQKVSVWMIPAMRPLSGAPAR